MHNPKKKVDAITSATEVIGKWPFVLASHFPIPWINLASYVIAVMSTQLGKPCNIPTKTCSIHPGSKIYNSKAS
jgi:hypothetical protein